MPRFPKIFTFLPGLHLFVLRPVPFTLCLLPSASCLLPSALRLLARNNIRNPLTDVGGMVSHAF